MVTESSSQLLPSEKKSSNHSDHEKGPVTRKHTQSIYEHLKNYFIRNRVQKACIDHAVVCDHSQ